MRNAASERVSFNCLWIIGLEASIRCLYRNMFLSKDS